MVKSDSSTDTKRKCKVCCLTFLAVIGSSLPFQSSAFGGVSPLGRGINIATASASASVSASITAKQQQQHFQVFDRRTSARSQPSSPLFVATANDDTSGNSADNSRVIRSIEAKMEKFQKSRDKYVAKLDKYEARLRELQQTKAAYLEGSQLGKIAEGENFTETALRSAVKAFLWRVIAGLVTLVFSLKFSGSIATALRIVSSDFTSKSFTMFLGERLMNKSQAGRKTGADSASRSFAKAVIWRMFAICNTLTVSFFFAKDLKMASKIAGSDALFKTGLMFFYERVWARIDWGKEYLIEFSI